VALQEVVRKDGGGQVVLTCNVVLGGGVASKLFQIQGKHL
jgi:hypothetical protein